MVVQRLHADAVELSKDLGTDVWGEHTAEYIPSIAWLCQSIEEIFFSETTFCSEGSLPDGLRWTDSEWRALIPPHAKNGTKPLMVCDNKGQGTTGDACDGGYCSFYRATQLWEQDGWADGSIFIFLSGNLDGVEFLRTRASLATSLIHKEAGCTWHVLKCAWATALRRGDVTIVVPPSLHSALILRPFKACHLLVLQA